MARLLLTLFLVLLCCAPAQAATRVARSGDFELRAREKGGRLCMTLKRAGHYQGQACGRIPRSPQRPLAMFPDLGFDNYAAAVAPSVRVAETESRRGRRERHRTFAARGFSARFVLLPAPPSAVFVRFYGAEGALLGIAGGPAGYISEADRTPVFGGPGDGVAAHTEPQLAPTPDEPDRLRTLACVDVINADRGSSFCDYDAGNGLVVMGECGGSDRVGGLVAPGIAAVRLTLGSGAEVTLPAGELPAAFGGRRAIGAPVPSGEAVRDAVALDAAGDVVARTAVGAAPGGQPCAGEDRPYGRFSGELVPTAPPSGAATVAAAGGEPLLRPIRASACASGSRCCRHGSARRRRSTRTVRACCGAAGPSAAR